MSTSARAIALLLLPVLGVGVSVAGDSLEIRPGKWEITTRMEMPMVEGGREKTEVECMRDGSFDPQSLVTDDGTCRVTDQKRTGNTLRWSVVCEGDGGTMTGSGEFTAEDATANGSMQMSMDVGGQTLTMRTTWKGRRIGDCD